VKTLLIFCKQCGFSQELAYDEVEEYMAWSEDKSFRSPFQCPVCDEILLNEEDWEVS
jgi:hypothetical protein